VQAVIDSLMLNVAAPMLVMVVLLIAWQIAARAWQEELKIRRFFRDQSFRCELTEQAADDRDPRAVA
jgi:hypothetical protein